MMRSIAETLKRRFGQSGSAFRFPVRVYVLELSLLAVLSLLHLLGPQLKSQAKPVHTEETPYALAATKPAAHVFLPFDPGQVADLLIVAVIQIESEGDPRKVGKHGERGLMQIKRSTWDRVTRRLYGKPLPFDLAFDPSTNVRIGRAYLAELQTFLHAHRAHWQSDERSLLLACYNAGAGAVRRAGFDVRRLAESVQDYVERGSNYHDLLLAEKAGLVKAYLMAGLASSRTWDS